MSHETYHLVFKAIVLSLVHLSAWRFATSLQKYDKPINSIGGGLAITYVFLVLLPELDMGHHFFGKKIYLLVLVSFILFYGLHKLRIRSTDDSKKYLIALAYSVIYNWLLIYGMPESVFDSSLHLALVTLAIGLHLLHTDITLIELDSARYRKSGRWILVLALMGGLATRLSVNEVSEMTNDIITALLAGAVIYSVFNEELPEVEANNLRWFVLGIVLYSVIVMTAGLV